MSDRRIGRRVLRGTLWTVAGVVALLLVASLLVLSGPGRRHVLDRALRAADRALPGTFEVEQARWDLPLDLRLTGVRWVDGPDTLVVADTLRVAADVGGLLRRDVHLQVVLLRGVRADAVRIRESLAHAGSTSRGAVPDVGAERSSGWPWPLRTGAVEGLPSLAVDRLRLDATASSLPGVEDLEGPTRLDLDAMADLRRGVTPRLRVRELEAAVPSMDLAVRSDGFFLDLTTREWSGSLRGHYTEAWPFELEAEGDGERWTLLLAEPDAPGPPATMGLRLDWMPGGEDPWSSGELDLVLRTPARDRLMRDAMLADALDSLPAFPGFVVRADGEATLRPEVGTALDLEIEPVGSLREARAHVDWGAGVLRFRDLAVRAEGLELRGEGQRDVETQALDVKGRITDLGWLAVFVRPPEFDSIDLRFDARVSGARREPDLALRLDGSVGSQGRRIDDLNVEARGRLGESPSFEVEVDVLSVPLRLRTAGRAQLGGDQILVDLAPLYVLDASGRDSLPATTRSLGAERPTRIRVLPSTARIEVDELRVRGDVAHMDGGGWYEPARGARGRLELDVPGPPSLLDEFVSEELAVSLRHVQWTDVSADLDLRWAARTERDSFSAVGRVSLPGPARLGGLLPAEGMDLAGLDDFRVDLDLRGSRDADGTFALRGSVDPTTTSWVAGRPLQVQMQGGDASVDSLDLELLGVGISGQASTEGDSLRGRWTLELRDPAILHARVNSMPSDLELELRAEGDLRGTRAEPELRLHVLAAVEKGELQLERAELVALVRGGSVERARLLLPEGIRGIPLALSEAEIGLMTEPRPSNSGAKGYWVTVRADGPLVGWTQLAHVRLDSTVVTRTDSLLVRWRKQELRNEGSFVVSWNGSQRRLDLRGLDLNGSLGRVVGEGFVAPDTSTIDARMVLSLPPPLEGALRSIPRPDSLRVGIRTTRQGSLELTVDLERMTLGEPTPVDLSLRGRFGDPVVVDLRLAPEGGPPRIEGHIEIDPRKVAGPVSFPAAADSVHGTIIVTGLALPERGGALPQIIDAYLRGATGPVPRADLEVRIAGRLGRPDLDVEGGVEFPQGWATSQDRIAVEAHVDSLRRLEAALQWERANRVLLEAGLALAVQDTAETGTLLGGPLVLHGETRARSFDLAGLNPLLPPGMSLRGALTLDLSAEGSPRAPVVRGTGQLRDLFVQLSEGSRAHGRADLELVAAEGGGTLARGAVRILQGTIHVPEFRDSLAPVEGSSLLWELEQRSPRVVEGQDPVPTPGAEPVNRGGAEGSAAEGPLSLDVAIKVEIPNGIWIRSDRYEIEMGGALEIELSGGEPVLVGALTARAGGLTLLGQRFEVRSGEVTFYGGDVIDPALDVVMGTRKDDVEVRVLVQGTALRPRLTLESDPPMSESDIFTHLLFGERKDQLEPGQNDLLVNEATGALQAFAIPAVERELTSTFGLDMVRIGRSADRPDTQTLVAGKYLSPNALLSYEQNLEEGDSFFVTLRYWISQELTVESRLGRSDPSSVELNWSTDF